ncbi:MAG: glycosyltransferase WbuB [Leptolyngbya sp. PLA1]|nr:glycosyltransferase WbuB [Leptolyngbya sp. PLA1]
MNQPFFPDVVATAQMGKDLADVLAQRGHEVHAIASRSIYGHAGATLPPEESVPVSGAAQPILVHRVGASFFGKGNILARLADFAFFYLLALWKLLAMPRPDVVVSFTTPPLIGFAGLVARFFRASRAVHWVMDLYPDVLVACGVTPPRGAVARVVGFFSTWLLRSSDANVVLGRCMEERVLSRGVRPERVVRIPVWADLRGIEPVAHESNPFRARWAPGGQFVVMYSGNFGLGHDASTILDAILRLRDHADIVFVFVGSGKRKAEVLEFVARHGLKNVSWNEYAPREQLGQSLSAGDVHLISLREGAEGAIVPSKLFGIMAVARPALFVGNPKSEIARVLEECQGGSVLREGQGEALARAILDLKADPDRRRQMGDRARGAIAGRYDKETACRQWADLLERLG